MPPQRKNGKSKQKSGGGLSKKIKKNTSAKVKNKNQNKKNKKNNLQNKPKAHKPRKTSEMPKKEETVEEKLDRFYSDKAKIEQNRQTKDKETKSSKLNKPNKPNKPKLKTKNKSVLQEVEEMELEPEEEDIEFFKSFGDGALEIIERMSIPDQPKVTKSRKEKKGKSGEKKNKPEEWEETRTNRDWVEKKVISLLPTKKMDGTIIAGESIEKDEEVEKLEEAIKENADKKRSKRAKKKQSRKIKKAALKQSNEEGEGEEGDEGEEGEEGDEGEEGENEELNAEEDEENEYEDEEDEEDGEVEEEKMHFEIIKQTKKEDTMDEDLPPELLKAKLYQQRQERIQSVKEQLATLAAKILEDPEQRIKSIETFREMCAQEKDITIKKYIILSELAVYKDIIPGYKIRLPSEKDLQVKVSKEVKKLRAYEAFLLQSYQKYLHYLSHIIKRSPKSHFSEDAPPNTILTVACKCLGTLLLSAPYFNFTANIINTLVPLANAHCQQLAEMAQKTIKELFISYKSSETVFEVVKKIYTFLKSRSFSAQPELLALYLHLPLTEQLPEGTQITVGVAPKGRLSKRQKKKDKVEEKLQKDLREAMAEEDKSYRRSIQTETLKTVFLVYFKILKLPTASPVLLPAALEGLAKFSHLINVDVLVDLLELLRNMITSPTLNPISKLHCAITAFQTLKLQGQSLSLDLKTFFNAFFEILFDILPRVATTDNLIPAVLRCFQLMFKETKQLSIERVAAFIQRILMLSLYLPANSAIAFLSVANSLFNQYPKTQLLLDNQYRGSGIYLPEVDDPEHQNALASTAWQFALLQKHAHPVLRHFAKLVVTMSDMEGTPPPLDLYHFYKPVDTNKKTPRSISYCYPPIPEPKLHQLQKNINKESKKQGNSKKSKNEIVKAWFVRPAYPDTPFLSSLTERYQKIGDMQDAAIQNQFKEFFEDMNSVVVIST